LCIEIKEAISLRTPCIYLDLKEKEVFFDIEKKFELYRKKNLIIEKKFDLSEKNVDLSKKSRFIEKKFTLSKKSHFIEEKMIILSKKNLPILISLDSHTLGSFYVGVG